MRAGIAGTLGTVGLAAHACLTSMVMLYWQWIGCTTIATTIRVGNHLGAGDAYRARCAALVPAVFLPVIVTALWVILYAIRDKFACLLQGICIHNKSRNLHLILGLNYA